MIIKLLENLSISKDLCVELLNHQLDVFLLISSFVVRLHVETLLLAQLVDAATRTLLRKCVILHCFVSFLLQRDDRLSPTNQFSIGLITKRTSNSR